MSYLAIDLGAGSGRAIVGTIKDNKLELTEVFRFTNAPVKLNNTLYWNFLSLFANVKAGIRQAIMQGYQLQGIAIDTWGVDFGLLDANGELLTNPVCYRDLRTAGMSSLIQKYISSEKLYEITGIQEMEINTIFQLLSLKESKNAILPLVDKLLFMPDLINYFLTGVMRTEYTIASTSQMMDVSATKWSESILTSLNLPTNTMADIIQPGSCLGNLSRCISDEIGGDGVKVFSIASHDTASAIAAIPEEGDDWAFLSSGTWSLLGVSTDKPLLTDEARLGNFTNEGGANGKILFLRNITGLWLLQQLLDEWQSLELKTYSYEYLLDECLASTPLRSVIDCDDSTFVNPSSMSTAIQDYCIKTNQYKPETKGEFVRCIIESLAVKYKEVMTSLQNITGRKYKRLFVVGGGSQNKFLNQCIADALGIEVITGLTESTAIGNIIQQALANNELSDWEEAYGLIRNSFTLYSYYPERSEKQ